MTPRVIGVLLCIGALALLAQGLRQAAVWRSPGPALSGRAVIPELVESAEIVRDAFAIPHIRAANLADAYRALGFVHAQDRLWQMEVLRRAARGRLSELFGERTLAQDRLARMLGLGRAAEAEARTLDAQTSAWLAAYAQGVNAWIEQLRVDPRPGPAELRWLEVEPEPWTAADTLSIVRLRAFLLSRSLGASLLLERLNRGLGGTGSQDFFPVQPVPPEPPEPPEPRIVGSLHRVGEIADAWAAAVGLDGAVGSLGFVVGSDRSASEKPLLLNDPHVEFQAPAVFYFAHVATPDHAIAGGTWPGVPAFWMGHNRRIAWGQVALHAVVTDLFDETLRPDGADEYWARGGWRALEQHSEEIRVRSGDPISIALSRTHHGPLLGALLPDDPTIAAYSLRWTGQAAESGIRGQLGVQHADDWASFRRALGRIPAPPATYLYGDVRGNAGTQVAGQLPLRVVSPGLLSVPGEYDWVGFVPFEELPSSYGRKLGHKVVSTRGDGSQFGYPVEWLWSDGGAARRLEALLRERPSLSLEEALALQRDRHSERGLGVVRALVGDRVPTTEAARRVAEILREWDGSTDASSIGASVYHVFRQRLVAQLLEERLGSQSEMLRLVRSVEPLPGVLVERFLDRVRPDRVEPEIDQALAETWTWLGLNLSANPKRWPWGALHRITLEHAFDRLGARGLRWSGGGLSRGPFPAPGDPDSVWTMYHDQLPAESVALGPAARYAVDLGDLGHALIGLAGGQSGHAGSPHYVDGLEPWLRGEARPLWMHRIDVAYHEAGRWALEPREPREPE